MAGSAFAVSFGLVSSPMCRALLKVERAGRASVNLGDRSIVAEFIAVSARKLDSGESGRFLEGRNRMSNILLKVCVAVRALLEEDEAQDLVEYALLLCLITLALITGMNGIAKAVNQTFSSISSSLS